MMVLNIYIYIIGSLFFNSYCCAPLHEECPQHHVHKRDSRVKPETCDAMGWEGLCDPSVGEGPGRLEHLPPIETRSHKGKGIIIG